MRKLILLLLVCVSLHVTAQQKPELIMDETTISQSGEKNFKIQTSNDSVFAYLTKLYNFKIERITISKKDDRFGKFWVYNIYFSNLLRADVLKNIAFKFP